MSAAVTILSRLDGQSAGKTLTIDAEGTIRKQVAGHSGRYSARTLNLEGDSPAAVLGQYRALVETLTPAQCCIIGAATEMGSADYQILPQSAIERRGGDPQGINILDGKPTIARLKTKFEPSRLLLLDFDPDAAMPAEVAEMDEPQRWARLCEVLPELKGAARLVLPSSSARVQLEDGSPAMPGKRGTHTYVLLERAPTTDELDAMRVAAQVRLWAAGLGFFATSASGAALKRAVIDTSVFSPEREVFDGAPAVGEGLRIGTAASELHEGGCAQPIAPASAEQEAAFARLTGARVVRQPAQTGATGTARAPRLMFEDHNTLRLHTVIETEKGTMTVAEFLARPEEKLRCQATFRASTSWNGILRKHKHGCFLYDQGTAVMYKLCSDPQQVEGALGKALKALERESPANAHGYARAILFRHNWRCPVQMSYAGLAKAIHKANPATELEDLLLLAEQFACKRRALASSNVTINPKALPQSVTYRTAERVEEVHEEARLGGLHLLKSPQGTRKTEGVLGPLATEAGAEGVLAIAPLVSLVGDLSRRCEVAHYHSSTAGETALAICLNSIANPKYQDAIDGSRVVLVDEIARCVRACHDPGNITLKDGKGREVWEQLGELLRKARVGVGVDADLSTEDVRLLAQLTGRPITVWEIAETKRDITATFEHEDVAVADLVQDVAAGERVLGYADSANRVASLAAHLREQFPDKNIVAVHSGRALATNGTLEAEKLLGDINANVGGIDVLLLSPTVESGISLTVPHFTRHYGFYCGQLTPSQMNQGLLRDRTATSWTLAIMGNGFHSRPESFGDMLNGLAASSRKVSALSGGAIAIEPASDYDRACCSQMAESARSRNSYAAELWHLLEHRGWTLKRGRMRSDKAGREIRAEARVQLRAERAEAVLAADDPDERETANLRAKHKHSPEESAQIARVDVRAATGKADGELSADDVDLWQEGRLEGQAQRLEDALADPGATERDHVEAEMGLPLSARHLDGARREAVHALFAALGIDPATGDGEITAESALAAWQTLKSSPHAVVLARCGIAQFHRPPKYAVRWANDVLAKFGLWLSGTGHEGRRYSVEVEPKQTEAGEVLLPGFALMAEVVERRGRVARRCAYKESIAACSRCEPAQEAAA